MAKRGIYTVYAIDFDGTLCENAFPEIGVPKPAAIKFVKAAQAAGCKVILWTCRAGDRLREAVEWCADQGLIFDAINDNLPEMVEKYGINCRKVCADCYIDDKSMLPDSYAFRFIQKEWFGV